MAHTKRYLIAQSRPQVPLTESVLEQSQLQSVRKLKGGRHVVEMTEEQAQKLAQEHPDLLIEEDQELQMFFPLPGIPPQVAPSEGKKLQFQIVDQNNNPLPETTLLVIGNEFSHKSKTDRSGLVEIVVQKSTLLHIIILPKQGYWSRVLTPEEIDEREHYTIALKPLPEKHSSWGHQAIRMDMVKNHFTGKGIRIAIIDSGIAPHPNLHISGGYNTLDGQDISAWNVDEKGHGTHCCGIAAALGKELALRGVAPEAEIFSLKVFPGGRISDLLEAIEWSVENHMDILSMSLGGTGPSPQLEQALSNAFQQGITCVAAAGNGQSEVAFPAQYEVCISVTAVGKRGSYPHDSGHVLQESPYQSPDGQYYAANFTNFGPRVDVCAPGVAVISTVPSGYAAWDGTSMATPFVAGLAALILEAYPEIRTGDAWQSTYVREILKQSCIDLGLAPELQGAGMIHAPLALRSAIFRKAFSENAHFYQQRYLQGYLASLKARVQSIESSLIGD